MDPFFAAKPASHDEFVNQTNIVCVQHAIERILSWDWKNKNKSNLLYKHTIPHLSYHMKKEHSPWKKRTAATRGNKSIGPKNHWTLQRV